MPTAASRLSVLALLLALVSVSFAQDPAPAPATEDLTELEPAVLLPRASTAAAALTAVRDRYRELESELAELAASLAEKAAAREAFELPDAPEPTTPTAGPETVQAVIDGWTARLAALEQLTTLVGDHRTLARRHRDKARELGAEARLLGQALGALEPLLAEVARRQQAGDLAADAIPEAVTAIAADLDAIRTAADPSGTAAVAARAEVVIAEAGERLAALAPLQQAATAAQRQATGLLEEATRRADLRRTLADDDPAALVSALTTGTGPWLEQAAACDAAVAEVATAFDELEAAAQAIRDMAAPDPDAIEVPGDADEIESLRRARQSLALAEATRDWRQRRNAAWVQLAADAEALETQLAPVVEQVVAAFDVGVELDVTAAELRARIEAGTAGEAALPDSAADLAAAVGQLRDARADLARRRTDLTARRETIAGQKEASDAALAEATTAVETQRKAVEREVNWASFIAGVADMEWEALLATYTETATELATATAAIAEADTAVQAARERVDAATQALALNHDPVVLAATTWLDAFDKWLGEQRLPARPASPDGSGDSDTAEGSEEPDTPDAATSGGSASGTAVGARTRARITELRELRDRSVTRRLDYARDHRELQEKQAAARKALVTALEQQHAAIDTGLGLARRVWGCASALQEQSSGNEVALAQLPGTVAAHARRDSVIALQNRLDTAAQQLAAIRAELEAGSTDGGPVPLIEPMQAWRDNLSMRIETLSERLEREEAFPPRDAETLSELELKQRQHDIERRRENDRGTWEKVLRVFSGSNESDIDELIRGYYEQLVELERQQANVGERSGLTQSLVELAEQMRATFASLEEVVVARLADATRELDVAVTRARAMLRPTEAPSLLAALKERTGVEIAPGSITPLPPDDETNVEARQQALAAIQGSLQQAWARDEGYRRWLAQLRAEQAQLGGIDKRVGQLKDAIAALGSQAEDLKRRVGRLTGFTEADWTALPETSRPADKSAWLLGEIGTLRRERVRELTWQATGTLIWLVLIPVFAFLAIRGASLVGNRLLRRFTIDVTPEDKPNTATGRREREERARTLVQVFRAAWTIIVVVLSAIYMLKVVNVDVTPLIASAGIFGLAVAFGAQPLMRDFFAGFFILLENQYNLGDVCTINGVTGTVERITLRLTIIRDLEGQVHYLPNGTIDLVSNMTKAWARAKLNIGVSYDAEPDDVVATLKKAGDELKADGSVGRYIMEFDVLGIDNFGDNSVDYRVHIKVVAGQQWGVARAYRKYVKLALDAAGIEIPFPQRVVHQAPSDL